MPEIANNSPRMPGHLALVQEVADSYFSDKSRSRVLQIDKQTLIDLGLIITDPERPLIDGYEFLEDELGRDVVSRSAYYYFAADFKDRFAQTVSAHRGKALRIAELAIDDATAGRQDNLATVLKTQLMRLAAEGLLSVDDIRAFSGKHLAAIIALLDGHTNAKFRVEEMHLKQADAERKAAKLESDLAKASEDLRKQQLENQQRERKLQAELEKQQRAITAAEMAVKDGAKPEVIVDRVREILGLPTAGQQGGAH